MNTVLEFFVPQVRLYDSAGSPEIVFKTGDTQDGVLSVFAFGGPIYDFTYVDPNIVDRGVALQLRGDTFAVRSSSEDFPVLSGKSSVVSKSSNYALVGGSNDIGCKLFTNSGATSAVTFTLPAIEDSSDVGYCVSFVDVAGQLIYVDPDINDKIIPLTDSNGDRAQSSGTVGDLLNLVAVSDSEWIVAGKSGIWTDAN